PEESETLALAANQGTLNFALRHHEDEEIVLTAGADVTTALAANRLGAKSKAAATPAPTKAKKKATVVEVINGSDRQSVEF
ncbi:MAG: Flp pilus assembly protein CpaB, partial [Anaerolineae bacterium]